MLKYLPCLILPLALQAATLELFNDSAFSLQAVILSNSGQTLGAVTLPAGASQQWSNYSMFGGPEQNPSGSLSPYQVIWYCPQGAIFSSCGSLAEGAEVSPMSCSGPLSCPQPKDTSPYSNANPAPQ